MNKLLRTLLKLNRFAILVSLSTVLVACGGSDDDDPDPNPNPPPTTPDPEPEPEPEPEEFTPVMVEAEGGGASTLLSMGESMAAVESEGEPTYVRAEVNGTTPPEDDSRVTTLEVTFPEAGTYELYVRFRVGPGGADDDSMYLPSTFGTEHEWVLLNGMSGYVAPGEDGYEEGVMVDTGGSGATGVWKWTKVGEVTYEIATGELVQTFRFAGREDGLDIDKFAFSRELIGYTVEQIEAGEAGEEQEPPVVPDPYTPPADQQPMAEGQDKWLGNVCCGNQATNFTAYFNQVTPENAGKWGSVEATRDVYEWDALDEAVALAEDNGYPFRFHVLLWGNQQPAWIEDLPPAEQLEEIQEWFDEVATRYGDSLDFIEVVNEFDNDPPDSAGNGGGNYIEALGGTGDTGYDWILEAFRMARATFPATSQLMLNEYSVINTDSRTDIYLEVVGLLQAEDLIDAIGFQAHAFSTRGSTEQMTANMDRLAATGLPLYATELDIDGPEEQQLLDYQRIFPTIWEHSGVGGITLWGYRPGMWRDDQGATLVHENGAEKLAMRWLNGYVRGTAPLVEGQTEATIGADAQVGDLVADLESTAAGGAAHPSGAEVQWIIVGGTGEDFFAIDAETGEITVADAPDAGTYDLLINVDVDRLLSDTHTLRITVE